MIIRLTLSIFLIVSAWAADPQIKGTPVTPTSRAISTTAPLTGGGNLTTSRTLSIPKADADTDGYLSAEDWLSFNTGAGLSGLNLIVNTGTPLEGALPMYLDETGTNIGPSQVLVDTTSDVNGVSFPDTDGTTNWFGLFAHPNMTGNFRLYGFSAPPPDGSLIGLIVVGTNGYMTNITGSGGATIASTSAVLKGDGAGNGVAASAGTDYLTPAAISDTAYNSGTWNAVTTIAPSKNAVSDEFEALITSIATKITSTSLDSMSELESQVGGANIITATEIDSQSKLEALTGVSFATDAELATKQASDSDLTSLASGITGIVKGAGNGGGYSAAASGTDYAPATSGTALLKGNGSGGFSNASSGTDYAPATSGSAILKGNGSGGFSAAVASTDYIGATSGSAIQKASSGGLTAASAGTDYQGPDSDLDALAANSSNGLWARTGSGTGSARTITAGAGVGVSNGDGVSGNPTLTWAPETRVNNISLWDGSQSTRTLTYDLSGTDPVWTIGSASVDLTTGALKVGGTNVVTSNDADAIPNGRTTLAIFDDHLGIVAGGPFTWTDSVSGASAVVGSTTPTTSRMGVIQARTGTTTNGWCIRRTDPATFAAGGGLLTFEAAVRIPTLSDGSETFTVWDGFSDAAAAGHPTDGIFFMYSSDPAYVTNVTKWVGMCRSNSVSSAELAGGTVTAGQFYTLRIEVNAAASSVEFFVDGSSIGTITSGIPTGTSRVFGLQHRIEKQVGTTSRSIDFDYTRLIFKATTPR